jgi:hypothetical protein
VALICSEHQQSDDLYRRRDDRSDGRKSRSHAANFVALPTQSTSGGQWSLKIGRGRFKLRTIQPPHLVIKGCELSAIRGRVHLARLPASRSRGFLLVTLLAGFPGRLSFVRYLSIDWVGSGRGI